MLFYTCIFQYLHISFPMANNSLNSLFLKNHIPHIVCTVITLSLNLIFFGSARGFGCGWWYGWGGELWVLLSGWYFWLFYSNFWVNSLKWVLLVYIEYCGSLCGCVGFGWMGECQGVWVFGNFRIFISWTFLVRLAWDFGCGSRTFLGVHEWGAASIGNKIDDWPFFLHDHWLYFSWRVHSNNVKIDNEINICRKNRAGDA